MKGRFAKQLQIEAINLIAKVGEALSAQINLRDSVHTKSRQRKRLFPELNRRPALALSIKLLLEVTIMLKSALNIPNEVQ